MKTAIRYSVRRPATPRFLRPVRTGRLPPPPSGWRPLPLAPWEDWLCELEMRSSQLEAENRRLREACEQLQNLRARELRVHEDAPFGWIRLDLDGTILDLNRTAATLLGRPKGQLLRRALVLFVAGSDRPGFLAHLKRCRDAHKTVSSDLTLQALGHAVPVQFSTAPLLDGRWRVREFDASLQDIAKRQQTEAALRQSEQSLRALIDASPHPIQFKDASVRWLLANPAMLELFELTGVDYRQKTDAELAPLSPFYRSALESSGRADHAIMETGGTSRNDVVIARPDGSARIIDFIKVPLRGADGWAKGLVVLGYDLTERNRLEAESLRVSEREQRRIGQDLHDGLGQQLTAIEMMCQSLKSDLAPVGPGLERQASRICQSLREAIAQTRSLAHGLTAFRPGGGGLQIALEELAQTTSSLGLVKCCFRCSSPVWLRDNEAAAHLFRIAQEAVNNAVKHGQAGEVTICLAQRDGAVRLKVSDDGKGLPTTREQGKGIGLQVMKHRASMLGAELEVASKPGRGVTVTCTLPSSE